TNSAGSMNSASATLVILDPPLISVQPLSVTNNAGTTVEFTVAASGTEPLMYQWLKNVTNVLSDGGNISGSTNDTLVLTHVLGADAADYTVIISNVAGILLSSNATLTVIDPVVSIPPVGLARTVGDSAQFSVVAVGTQPFTYQWQLNSNNLADNSRIRG